MGRNAPTCTEFSGAIYSGNSSAAPYPVSCTNSCRHCQKPGTRLRNEILDSEIICSIAVKHNSVYSFLWDFSIPVIFNLFHSLNAYSQSDNQAVKRPPLE